MRKKVITCCDCSKVLANRTATRCHSCEMRRRWADPSSDIRSAATSCRTHGLSTAPEYWVWHSIRERCENSKQRGFRNYGARGITVCERWKSFGNFIADMGRRPSPSHSIERRDNDGPYSPENCFWATKLEQVNNTRANVFLEYNGERLTIMQWARRLGMNDQTLRGRLQKGWSIERAFTQPLRNPQGTHGRRAKSADPPG